MKKIFFILFVLLMVTLNTVNAQDMLTAKVAFILKGDTIATDEPKMKLKICGITAPEVEQTFGRESRELLALLTASKMAFIKMAGKGKGYVYVDEYDIGLHMVSLGFAQVNRQELDKQLLPRYMNAEETAKKNMKGMWKNKQLASSISK